MLILFPFLSSAFVASPKYHTLPSRSWAYQSLVTCSGLWCMRATSWTTVVLTPRIVFVRCVTQDASVIRVPSLLPL